jgi:3-dehydroquinate synthase
VYKNLEQINEHLNASAAFVLVDENTLRFCYPKVLSRLPKHRLIEIKSGEENKTLQTCNYIWQKLTEASADRNAMLINLGGGVIGDVGGFAASCYKRGIRFVNIPTTLLAMVDASVGGKTGIDFGGYKNQIGLFREPDAVFIDTGFLETLPGRELRSGFAEVMKHYLIADGEAFGELGNVNWPELVEKNIRIKTSFVKQDPAEKHIRKALNFGHTIGHAVESYFLSGERKALLHGEAVAIGLITESFISLQKNQLSEEELGIITEMVIRFFTLPVIPEEDFNLIIDLLKQDKKSISGYNQFTLLKGIGNYSINNFVEEELIRQSLTFYNKLLA